MARTSAQVHKAFLLIQQLGPELGLELNVGKTEPVPEPFPQVLLNAGGAVAEQDVKRGGATLTYWAPPSVTPNTPRRLSPRLRRRLRSTL